MMPDKFLQNEGRVLMKQNVLMENWGKVLEILKADLTGPSYNAWISPINPIKIDEDQNIIQLSVYNEMATTILKDRYITILEKAIKEAFKKPLTVLFVEDHTEEKEIAAGANSNFTDELYLNPRYIFDTFVVGANNRLAQAASLAVAESPSEAYNPLFIYGGSGLGKTHLMHAIGHFILQKNPKTKVLYVSSEMFTNEIITAIGSKKTVEFRNKYRSIDVLLIDDIQFIEKKEMTQEEFFHTFEFLNSHNKQIIISSDRPPKDISTLDERLRSRFEWGLITDIQPPDFETRVAILRTKADLENVPMTESILEVIDYIAEKVDSNIRELEGAFNSVVANALLIEKKINKELAKEVLKDVFSSKQKEITANDVKSTVCKYYNIKLSDIESSKRSRNLSNPRQIAMFLCRDMTNLSLPKIGEHFGNRDHTTVLHACDKVSKEMKINESLRDIIVTLRKDINSN